MPPAAERTFLVESYVPNLDEAAAAALSSRLRSAIDELRREGHMLAWLRSFALVEEETYVWMLAAVDADDVALANRRAGLAHDAHVVEVVSGERCSNVYTARVDSGSLGSR